MRAIIYHDIKTAMQSGQAKRNWRLKFVAEAAGGRDSLMGWSSCNDAASTVHLKFDNKEQAVIFAKSKAIDYRVITPPARPRKRQSYGDNFRSNRSAPWTH